MEVPEQWRHYQCEDYFASAFATTGFWDEPSQLWVIEPADRVEEDREEQFLQVGSPGVDGISFGYRKGMPGFWAFRQVVDREFQYLVPTIQEFLTAWFAGRIIL